MEGFQDGVVIVKLRQRGIELDQEHVVDARMANIVADGRYEKREGIEGSEDGSNGRLGCRSIGVFVWRQSTDVKQKAKDRLQDIDCMSKIVVEDKGIVSRATSEDKHSKFICSYLLFLPVSWQPVGIPVMGLSFTW